MRHWFRSDMLRIRNDVVALNSRQYENAICLLPNLVCSASNLLQSIWARRPRRLGSEVWNLQPGLVHVKFSPPMLRLVWVDHGRIVSVKILMRNGNAERSAFAIIHRQRKRGAARGDEVRPSRSHHQALPALVVRVTRTFDNEEYGGHRELRHRQRLTWVARHDHHFELRNGRGVADDPRVSVAGRPRIDRGPAHAVREHIDQIWHVLKLGREAGTDYVVTARHAFDDLTGDVGVRLVGSHEEGFAGSNEKVVEEEGRHGSGIVGELLSQTHNGAGAFALPRWGGMVVGVEALLGVQPLEQLLQLFGRHIAVAVHEGVEEGAEGFALRLGIVRHEDRELGFVGNAR